MGSGEGGLELGDVRVVITRQPGDDAGAERVWVVCLSLPSVREGWDWGMQG